MSVPSDEKDGHFCPIAELPNELVGSIFDHLSLTHEDLLSCCQVNRKWYDIVNEKLLRTESCFIMNGKESIVTFNATEKQITELVILDNSVKLVTLDLKKVECLESFYMRWHRPSIVEDFEELKSLLGKSCNLTELTLKLNNNVELSHIKSLLSDLKHVNKICLIFNEVTSEYKAQLLELFNDYYYFYQEILIQIMKPDNELIYICSDDVMLHRYIQHDFTKVYLSHFNNELIHHVLTDKTKYLEIHSEDKDSADKILDAIRKLNGLESINLNNFSVGNDSKSWRTFFEAMNERNNVLKQLTLTNCFDVTCEDLSGLINLTLDKLHFDFLNCFKITNIEEFLMYSIQNISTLSISLHYSEYILNSVIDVFRRFSDSSQQVAVKSFDIEIHRANYCSEQNSQFIKQFRTDIDQIGKTFSFCCNVSEVFTQVKFC